MSVCCVVTVHGRDELLTDIVEDPTPPPPQSAEMENGWAGDVTELESACPPQLERVCDDELAASVSVASDDSSCPLLECQHLRSPLLQPLDESLALDTQLADAQQSTVVRPSGGSRDESTVVSVEPVDLPESLVCPDVVKPSGGSRDESTVVSVEPSDPREETVVVSTMPSGPQEHILDTVEPVQFQEECIASGVELADQQESTVVSRRPTDPPESCTLPAEPLETAVRSLNTEASDAQMCVLVDTESAESTDPQESMISPAVCATIPSSPGDLATSTSECSEARVSTDNDTSASADESEASEGRAQVMDACSESLTAAAESAAILTPESRDAMTSQSDRVPAAILAPESRDAMTSQSGGVCADAETDAGRGQQAADGRDDGESEMSGACSLQLPASVADAATWRDAGDWSGRTERRQEQCADTDDVSAVQQLAELETASTARLITAHHSGSSTSSCGSGSGLAGVGDIGPCSQNDESIAGRVQLELSSDSAAVSSQQHVAHSDDDIVSSDLQLSRSTEHTAVCALQTDDRVRGDGGDDEGQTRCSDVAEAGMMRSDETGAGGTVMTAADCSDANIGVTASDGGVDVPVKHACSTERCSGGTDAVDRCGCGVQCSYCYYSVASIRLLRQHSVFHVAFTDAARTPLFHATLDALVDGRMDDPRLYDSTAPLSVALCEPCRRLAAWHHSCDATATRHAPPAPAPAAAAAASGMRDTGALLTDAATGDVRDEVKANDDQGLADSTDPGTAQCASGLDTATDAGGLLDVHDEAKDDQGVAEADNRLDVKGDLQAKTVTDTGTFLVRNEVKDDQRLANSAAADSQLDTEAGVQAAENTDIAVDESAVDTSLGSSAERTEAIAKKSSPDSWNGTNSAAADGELDTEADVLAAENTDVRAVAESAMTVLESRYSQRDISPVLSNSTARHSSHKPVVSSSGRSDAQLYGAVTSQPLDDKVHFLSTLSLHSVT